MKRVLVVFLFLFSLTLTAQERIIGQSVTSDLIDQMEQVSDSELIRINIRLANQYDTQNLEEALSYLSRAERRLLVISELKSFSERTQKGILDLIEERTKSDQAELIFSLWINNVITAMASKDLIYELSQRSDIDRIDWDEERNMLLAQEGFMAGEEDPTEGSREITYNVNIMNVPAVWALGFQGQGVVVAVLDTGVNYNHLDLAGHMWTHPSYPNHGWNFVDNNNNPMDYHGHGTHCAGTVASDGTAGTQAGMAPLAEIMALMVLNSSGSGTESGVWAAIQFGVDYGADVLSLSLGWQQSWGPDRQSWRNSFNNALAAGIISSVAAGNEGTSPGVPNNLRTPGDVPPPWLHPDQTTTGGVSGVVSVGATNSSDNIASFSSRGPVTWQTVNPFNDYPYNPGMGLLRPDVTAPGVDVKSCRHNNNTGYTTMSGTSMATPGVAGVMALLLSKNPNLTPAKISEALEMTSLDLGVAGKDNTYGAGRVNALAAINFVNFPGPVYSSHTISDSNNNGEIEAGETVLLSIEMYNGSDTPRTGVNVSISSDSPYVTITDNAEFYGNFAAWEYKSVTDGFAFDVATNTPGLETIRFNISATDGIEIWTSFFDVVTYGPKLQFGAVTISDPTGNNNGRLDPGETVELLIVAQNTGQVPISNVLATINTASGYITFNTSQYNIPSIPAGGSVNAVFNLTVSASTPIGTPVGFDFNMVSGVYDAQKSETLIVGQIPVFILNLDPNNNSAPAMQTALSALGVAYETATTFPPDLNIYTSVFVCLGIYPNNTVLNSSQGTTLVNYLNSGGQVYLEGGDTWYYDPSTPVHAMFNINPVADGSGDMGTILGQTGTFTAGMTYVYSGENNWMDRIAAISPAYLILQNQSPSYGTGVAYNQGTYRTIGTSHEFGGLNDGTFPSTKAELMNQYLTFFGITGTPPVPPIIDVNPLSFEVTLEPEGNKTETLTISNTGDETLHFAISTQSVSSVQGKLYQELTQQQKEALRYQQILSDITDELSLNQAFEGNDVLPPVLMFPDDATKGEETFGSWSGGTWSGGTRDRGNIFQVTQTVFLEESRFYLTINSSTQLYFFVYEGDAATGSFTKKDEVYVASSGTGTGWYSSGAMNVELTAGKYYYIGASWNGSATYGRGTESVPLTTSFGSLMSGVSGTLAGYPPSTTINNTHTGVSPYYQTLVTSVDPGSNWLLPGANSGSVPQQGSVNIDILFNAAGLADGTYYRNLIITSNDPLSPEIIVPCTLHVSGELNLDLTVMLEGGFAGSSMSTVLNSAGFLPLAQPYNAAPWNYAGAESVTSIPNNDVVDWVLVELRETPGDASTATASTMIARQAAFLLNDGSIVDTDGQSHLVFNVPVAHNLYVVIWHRIHLAIMTALPVLPSGGLYSYDFTTGSDKVHGGSTGYEQLTPTIWGMVTGDGDANGQVDNSDKLGVWQVESGSSGYLSGDFNLDSQVNNSDKIENWMPNSGKSTQVP